MLAPLLVVLALAAVVLLMRAKAFRTAIAVVTISAAVALGPVAVDWVRPLFIGSHVERLKSYVAPEVLTKANPRFFSDGYSSLKWSDWRLPLVYPYESGPRELAGCGSIGRNDSSIPALPDVTELAFDANLLLIHREPRRCVWQHRWVERSKWGALQFSSGKSDWFDTEAAMAAEAAKRGYKGDVKLRTLDEAYRDYFIL